MRKARDQEKLEAIAKIPNLPKWAQQHIKTIEQQRDAAVRALEEFCDNDTPSAFFVEDYVCDGESKGPTTRRHYIQTRSIEVAHAGVGLRVLLRGDSIELSWDTEGRRLADDVIFQPKSFQMASLFMPGAKKQR